MARRPACTGWSRASGTGGGRRAEHELPEARRRAVEGVDADGRGRLREHGADAAPPPRAILVGAAPSHEAGQSRTNLARLTPDGTPDPGFDPRTYGHKQLSKMIASLKDRFEMRTKDMEGQQIFYVKVKE